MTITPGLAAELQLLTQALDLPGTDLAETVARLAAAAQTAVDSYLGLSVAITANRSEFDLAVLEVGTRPEDVLASLHVPLSTTEEHASTAPASIALILYAAIPGAFIDLAADLSWITGQPLADLRLDEHRTLPPGYTTPTALTAMSNINQALGVLIGRGLTLEQAERELYALATAAEIDLLGAATLVLATLAPADPEPS